MGESSSPIAVESPRARRALRVTLVALIAVFAVAALGLAGAALGMYASVWFGANIERFTWDGSPEISRGIYVGSAVGGALGVLAGVAVAVWLARLTGREFGGPDRV